MAVSIIPPGRLEWGVQLHVQSQSKTFAEEWEPGTGAPELAVLARKADEVGAFYIAVCDHVTVPKPADAHMRTTWYDPIATLGYLAAVTSRVRLMSRIAWAKRKSGAPFPGCGTRMRSVTSGLPSRIPALLAETITDSEASG